MAKAAACGGGTGFGIGGGKLGIGTVIVLGLLGWALGIDPSVLIGGAEMVAGTVRPTQQTSGRTGAPPANDQIGTFVAKILGETEDVWSQVLPAQANRSYEVPRLVMFSGATNRPAAARSRPWGRSIAPSTRRSISTRPSSAKCSGASAAAATSPTPM